MSEVAGRKVLNVGGVEFTVKELCVAEIRSMIASEVNGADREVDLLGDFLLEGLAAGLARLLLYTDPARLPELGKESEAWDLYLRTWRPGAYDRGTAAQRAGLRKKWAANYAAALEAVQ